MIQFASGQWEGLDGLGAGALDELRPAAERVVRQIGGYFAGEIKKTLTGKRHGRAYQVSQRGPLHIASAPGEPPAVLWGNLRNSIGFTPPAWTEGGTVCSCEVGVGLGQAARLTIDPSRTYARRLELGGVDNRGVRILARPYLAPTEERVRGQIDDALEGF